MHRPMSWWIRFFLISSALRGLLLGINGLLNYREISIPLQFTPSLALMCFMLLDR